jgi:hypothetical protein
LALAAVEDRRCALKWVIATPNNSISTWIALFSTGHSAGGDLSLTTPEAGLDVECPGEEGRKVAAIVNWYGVPR